MKSKGITPESPGNISDLGILTGMSMEVSKCLVSWFITHLVDLQPTYIGVMIHLLSTMDTLVGILEFCPDLSPNSKLSPTAFERPIFLPILNDGIG